MDKILYLPINNLTPKYNLIPKVTSYSLMYINSKSHDANLSFEYNLMRLFLGKYSTIYYTGNNL